VKVNRSINCSCTATGKVRLPTVESLTAGTNRLSVHDRGPKGCTKIAYNIYFRPKSRTAKRSNIEVE